VGADASEREYRRRLGRAIVQLRALHNVSQAWLAEKVGRSEAALSRWETGRRRRPPTTFAGSWSCSRRQRTFYSTRPIPRSVPLRRSSRPGPQKQSVRVELAAQTAGEAAESTHGPVGRPLAFRLVGIKDLVNALFIGGHDRSGLLAIPTAINDARSAASAGVPADEVMTMRCQLACH
jgi:DNA-binding XRE family transcriptional regulator